MWVLAELCLTPRLAFVVASVLFLVTLIVGLHRLGGLGILVAFASFFTGLAGHQAIRWHQVDGAPWIKDILVREIPNHPGACRFTFREARTLSDAGGRAVIRIKDRNGSVSSTTYYALPIVDRVGPHDVITAWSVAMTSARHAEGSGPRLSGTVVDTAFSDGYLAAVADAERKGQLKSHPRAVILSLGDPAEQAAGIATFIPVTLMIVNIIWLAACVAAARAATGSDEPQPSSPVS